MRATLMAMAAMQGLTHLPWGFSKGSTRNKYQPHQGKQEIARRLRRITKGGAA